LVAFPTETVYGLAAPFQHVDAIEEVFRKKNRPSDNPLIVHICDWKQVEDICNDIPQGLKEKMEAFWPGPLSIVLNANVDRVPAIVRAGLDTVAVRMPKHPLTLELIQRCGPLVAPSANKSGYPSPTKAQHILHDYDGKVFVLDGGPCESGLESTVLDVHDSNTARILRPGSIGKELLLRAGFDFSEGSKHENIARAPGMKHRHYAPKANMEFFTEWEVVERADDEKIWVITIDLDAPHDFPDGMQWHDFEGNFVRMAHELYALLRSADEEGVHQILVQQYPWDESDALQVALKNRLEKAVSKDDRS
jgi:L-threonylcarbamoyladenylate synthase